MALEDNNTNRRVRTPEERRANCQAYIDSDAFGMDKWLLSLFLMKM
jgi:hypothetical protein